MKLTLKSVLLLVNTMASSKNFVVCSWLGFSSFLLARACPNGFDWKGSIILGFAGGRRTQKRKMNCKHWWIRRQPAAQIQLAQSTVKFLHSFRSVRSWPKEQFPRQHSWWLFEAFRTFSSPSVSRYKEPFIHGLGGNGAPTHLCYEYLKSYFHSS